MRSYRAKLVALIVAAAVLFGVWTFFAPTKLGGTSTYSVTDGISMNPLLYKGDFAVIRAQSSYHVGEVVLYQSQILHKPVLHRIILIQNGNYFFKGDNNDFVDPGYATRSELIGALWFHVPHAGAVLGWFGVPATCIPAGWIRGHGRGPHRCQDIEGWPAPAPARPVAAASGTGCRTP